MAITSIDAVRTEFPTCTTPRDVGAETFKFVDATAFTGNKSRRWSPSGAVTVGFLTAHNIYVAGAVRVEKSYRAADDQATCTITAVSVQTACRIASVGAPTAETLKISEAEVRRYLPWLDGHDLGVSGIVHRDWVAKETSAEVPVFFVKDKAGGLSGGVSIGYLWSPRPDRQGPRFTVFVGQAFGLNNGY